MKGLLVLRYFIGVFILLNAPQLASGNNGNPRLRFENCIGGMPGNHTDTLPPSPKSEDNTVTKPGDGIIKAVPKARKQALPLPVVSSVKPIQIIRPKIIKPIIKVRL
ncbi:MAG: hypothetical protein JWP81_4711 [Ferruginibacter sp.]|nr:hypothetical protein [Ferruginibacter sp.]